MIFPLVRPNGSVISEAIPAVEMWIFHMVNSSMSILLTWNIPRVNPNKVIAKPQNLPYPVAKTGVNQKCSESEKEHCALKSQRSSTSKPMQSCRKGNTDEAMTMGLEQNRTAIPRDMVSKCRGMNRYPSERTYMKLSADERSTGIKFQKQNML